MDELDLQSLGCQSPINQPAKAYLYAHTHIYTHARTHTCTHQTHLSLLFFLPEQEDMTSPPDIFKTDKQHFFKTAFSNRFVVQICATTQNS